jgi:hypothetical protein
VILRECIWVWCCDLKIVNLAYWEVVAPHCPIVVACEVLAQIDGPFNFLIYQLPRYGIDFCGDDWYTLLPRVSTVST